MIIDCEPAKKIGKGGEQPQCMTSAEIHRSLKGFRQTDRVDFIKREITNSAI
jgi:hypothetical protein